MSEVLTITERMELPHPPGAVYALVTDLDAVAPCVPGAKLDPPAEGVTDGSRGGQVVIGFGPIRYRYKGTIRITATDPQARTVDFDAAGEETSGEGTLGVQMRMEVGEGEAGGSTLDVKAEVELTGMIADYGAGMAQEVAGDVISQFVRAVKARDLSELDPEPVAEGSAAGTPGTAAASTGAGAGAGAGEGAKAPVRSAPAAAKPIGGFRLLVRALFRQLRRKLSRSGRKRSGTSQGSGPHA